MNDCTRPPRAQRPTVTAAAPGGTGVDHLLRGLLLAMNGPGNGRGLHPDADYEEIMLDVDLDGCRYLLVRMPRPDRERAHLSPREQEIARMVAAGHASKTIASVLNISSWTVGTHLRRIFAKLGVKTRAAMVGRLHEIGIAVQGRANPTGLPDGFDNPEPTKTRVDAANRRAMSPLDV